MDAAEQRRILLGIGLACLPALLFPFMNSFSKMLGADYNVMQESWARFFGHVLFGMVGFSLVGWLLASIVMWVTKRVSGKGRVQPATA